MIEGLEMSLRVQTLSWRRHDAQRNVEKGGLLCPVFRSVAQLVFFVIFKMVLCFDVAVA